MAARIQDALPRPEMNKAGKSAVALLVWLGLGAVAGGVALVSKPDGSVMQLPVSMLAGSPFNDFLIPGLILGALFGAGSFVVAILGWRRVVLAPFLAFAIGCGQMIWIVVELAIIKGVSVLHPLYFCTGLAIAIASIVWGLPTFRAWEAARAA